MVSIDRVYQRVLALANKEQRGYITPQDFNLFANQAQMEIFEQYFYDVNMARKGQGNDTVYADIDDMLEEKLQIFERVEDASSVPYTITSDNQGAILPIYVYRVNSIYWGGGINNNSVSVEILNTKDFYNCLQGPPLLRPKSPFASIANIRNNEVRVFNGTIFEKNNFNISFFKVPSKVEWAYVVMNNKAMYNEGAQVDFELHRSEETQLVNKILKLAGISIKQPDVVQVAAGIEGATNQQQPKI